MINDRKKEETCKSASREGDTGQRRLSLNLSTECLPSSIWIIPSETLWRRSFCVPWRWSLVFLPGHDLGSERCAEPECQPPDRR